MKLMCWPLPIKNWSKRGGRWDKLVFIGVFFKGNQVLISDQNDAEKASSKVNLR